VKRNRNLFTPEENDLIDILYFCNYLRILIHEGLWVIPSSISLPTNLSGEKFSLVVNALEAQQTGWAYLTAAFLLSDVIETEVDLSDKNEKHIDEYWRKRFHDTVSFYGKSVELNSALKPYVDRLLLHIKAEEYYHALKQRINTLLLEPDIESFYHFQRTSVQALFSV